MGQKQTCAVQKGMSALPPKADIDCCLGNVRFVPIADKVKNRIATVTPQSDQVS
jgi:hypothetical protein